jgi:hypothetical protein
MARFTRATQAAPPFLDGPREAVHDGNFGLKPLGQDIPVCMLNTTLTRQCDTSGKDI